jgi:hypothetical protein
LVAAWFRDAADSSGADSSGAGMIVLGAAAGIGVSAAFDSTTLDFRDLRMWDVSFGQRLR